MKLDSLRLMRDIFLRSAVVAIVIAILMFLGMVTLWSFWTGLTIAWIHTNEAQLSLIVLQFFTAVRFFAVFLLLVPGLALHWTLVSERRRTA